MTDGGSELFISDLHLCPHEPATAARFFDFLAGPARQTQRLTILGDLFDYWAGDDDLAAPFNTRIVSALRTLSTAGVSVGFMAGNRDFLVGTAFATAAGLELLPDPCVRNIAGTPTLLTHGDRLCTDDADYQRFRAQVRQPDWRRHFLARPLAERKREIETLRQRSEAEKRSKPHAIMDVNATAVHTLLHQQGVAVLIHGHTHRQAMHPLNIAGQDGQRWVLGDWHDDGKNHRGTALACTSHDWAFL